MDDAFSLVASRMPRTRRLSPFGVRVIVLGVVVAFLIAMFTAFVVVQQRAADARRATALQTERATVTAQAQAAAVEVTAIPSGADGAAVADMLDGQAKDSAAAALDAATRLSASSGLDAATTAGLTALQPDVLFVDGSSTAPSIVSVYVGTAGWAAAVHGGGDTCYWVARTPTGRDRYGTGTVCTGVAALAADQPSW